MITLTTSLPKTMQRPGEPERQSRSATDLEPSLPRFVRVAALNLAVTLSHLFLCIKPDATLGQVLALPLNMRTVYNDRVISNLALLDMTKSN